MRKEIASLILITILIINGPVALAKGYYGNLPKLDGKVDSGVDTEQPGTSLSQPDLPTQKKYKPAITNVDTNDSKTTDLALTSPKMGVTPRLNTDKPKLDELTPALTQPSIGDIAPYEDYETDLNRIITVLKDIKICIKDGATLQLLSAKVTTARFLTEGFRNKYKNSTPSKFETYRLVQDIVNTAIYTRDFWLKANKMNTNSRGMNDKIIQTKFLQISTDIEKLLELMKIEGSLSEE